MKIQIDYDRKIITLERKVLIRELFNKLKVILPDWQNWQLETNTTVNWGSPIIIEPRPYFPRPWWEVQPIMTYGSGTTTAGTTDISYHVSPLKEEPTSGVYQMEIR